MKIKAICGVEPRNDCQEPLGATCGYNGVTAIIKRDENLGTYGIAWFDIYKGDTVIQSINALSVASVFYFESEGGE